MKIIFYANTEWYLYNFRLGLARHLRNEGHEVVMVSPPGRYGQKLEAAGFRWIPVDMRRRSLNPMREARMVLSLADIYRDEKPSLVHHFTLKCIVYGGIAARLARVPAAVHAVAGLGYVFASKRLRTRLVLRPLVRRLLGKVCNQPGSAVIVQNSDDLAFIESLPLSPRTPLALIRGSGVDTSRFTQALRSPPDAGAPLVVLFVGRLLFDKGIVDFVETALRCRQEGGSPGMRFLVAGEPDPGNPASVPLDALRQWKEAGVVEFLGHVEDMAGLLAMADIVVLPSRAEGAPRSLIEAAACGIPLVATDVPGCREVVLDGQNGFLVPLHDIGALVAAVLRLAGDDELRRRMGESGRRLVLESLDEKIVFERTVDVYRQLLPGPWEESLSSTGPAASSGTSAHPRGDTASSAPPTGARARRAG
ncbi:MAG: glycosyltransferase family 4 protein [Burkholderiaceae bacterium]|nr:glycosyltransferase family 4 protein [Burkholderiaceae bacterium]